MICTAIQKLVDFIMEKVREEGYEELSVGVDLDNYPALKLYHAAGFDTILYIGEDRWGKNLKLMRQI